MIYDLRFTIRGLQVGLLAGLLGIAAGLAFPPAPHHVIHGSVRDELGDPISLTTAQVFLETTNGLTVACQVSPDIQPGENYRLIVPMDSITVPDLYKPTALPSTIPFKLKVKIGATIYLPLEMAGNFATLGQPAGTTLINLTLGVDSDGDGLPDAWEQLIIQMLGGGLTLANITPNGIAPNGMTYYQNYVAGTYAWDPQDALKLNLIRRPGQGPVVQFFGIAGRSYSVLGTTNLVNWTTMFVRVPPGNTNVLGTTEHFNPTSQMIETEVLLAPTEPKAMFFRVRVN
jgi:hypothetical protein